MVGYIGGSVDVLSAVDISGDGMLITPGRGRIGRPGKGEIFGKAGDEVGIMGTVMMYTLLLTSQTPAGASRLSAICKRSNEAAGSDQRPAISCLRCARQGSYTTGLQPDSGVSSRQGICKKV